MLVFDTVRLIVELTFFQRLEIEFVAEFGQSVHRLPQDLHVRSSHHTLHSQTGTSEDSVHRRTAWGVQGGRGRLVGGPPLYVGHPCRWHARRA
jgi:hypothetical protein